MDNYLKFFEDDKFVQWVYNPDQKGTVFWNAWFVEHPEDRKDAEFAQLILLQLKSKKEKGNKNESDAIYSAIVEKLSKSDRQFSLSQIILPFSRYAAVALLFLSLGVFLTYNVTKKQNLWLEQSMNEVHGNAESQLILADGRRIALNAKESSVEYGTKGKIVINQSDTIENHSKSLDTEMNQLIVPFGKNSSILLPDGTVAHLNAGSRLMYPSVFSGKNREVFLSGEGYFEVSHDPKNRLWLRPMT